MPFYVLARQIIPQQNLIELSKKLDINSNQTVLKKGFARPLLPSFKTQANSEALQMIGLSRFKTNGSALVNWEGANWEIGLWDFGNPRLTHQEFGNRISILDTASAISVNGHATAIAGSIMASGVDAQAVGAVSEGLLSFYDVGNDISEMAYAAAFGLKTSVHPYVETTGWIFNLLNDGRWVWYADSTISATENAFWGFYSKQSSEWDQVAMNAPNYVIVKAAGNYRNAGPVSQPIEHWIPYYDELSESWKYKLSSTIREKSGGEDGFQSISHASVAKNVLVIGNVDKISTEYSRPDDVIIISNSGFGPTDDGRIKPDLVAPGNQLYTTSSSSNTSYTTSSGTSAASAITTGVVAFVQSYYKNLTNKIPSAALIKSLLIHTTDEAGTAPGPDYRFGWGLINAQRATRFIQSNTNHNPLILLVDTVLNEGQSLEFSFPSFERNQLKATIYWTDPAATELSLSLNPTTKVLINDLDLRMKSASQTEYFPWKLDGQNPQNAATQADNDVDNVEQVFIENPSGIYTVSISHKGNLQGGSQRFALVISSGEPLSEKTITGAAGWRLLAFPNDLPLSDFAKQSAIQGISGVDFGENGNPNLYSSYDGSSWVKPNSIQDSLKRGDGFIHYFFNNNSNGSKVLPFTLWADGKESELTSTKELVIVGDSLTMLGNPFSRAIDFSKITFSGGDLHDIGWLWDSANGWVSISQQNEDIIPAFSGFFVKSLGANQIQIPYSARISSNVVNKRVQVPEFKIKVISLNGNVFSAFDEGLTLHFLENAHLGYDRYDAPKMSPLSSSFAILKGKIDEVEKDLGTISLPKGLENPIEIKIKLQTSQNGIYQLQTQFDESLLNQFKFEYMIDEEDFTVYDGQQNTIQVKDNNLTEFRLRVIPVVKTHLENQETLNFYVLDVFPNPFNPSTKISISLVESTNLSVFIYDMLGRKVQTLANGAFSKGKNEFYFDGSSLSSGVYLVKVESKNYSITKKIALIK